MPPDWVKTGAGGADETNRQVDMTKLALVTALLLSVAAAPAIAGLMTVIATDHQGRQVEAIEVVAVNLQTKFQVKKATNKFGSAHLGWVPGGVYRITASLAGRQAGAREINVTAAPVQIEFKGVVPAVVAKGEGANK